MSKYEASTTSDVTNRQKDALLRELIGCALELQRPLTSKTAEVDVPYPVENLPESISKRFPPIHSAISSLVQVSISTPLKPKRTDHATIGFIRHGIPRAKPVTATSFRYTCWKLTYTAADRGQAGGLVVGSKLSGRHTYLGPINYVNYQPSGTAEDILRETTTDHRKTRVYPRAEYDWPPAIDNTEMSQLIFAVRAVLYTGRIILADQWSATLPDA